MPYTLLRPLLFRVDSEQAHNFTLATLEHLGRHPTLMRLMARRYVAHDALMAQDLWGLHFPAPVGLAAGADKNARAVAALTSLGFGFIEVGTITPLPQEGNPLPRLFRLPHERAIINRMGFPNEGAQAVAARLAASPRATVPLGINLGKNKNTPLETAAADYVAALEALFPYGDYCVINVSSPNTPGLRLLQGTQALRELLSAVQESNRRLARLHECKPLPCLLKIAPDLAAEDLADIAQLARNSDLIDGLIATNTTLDRRGLGSADNNTKNETGGLSGAPLKARSTAVIHALYAGLRGATRPIPIIGVGGIENGADALEKIRAGASLVQVYSGMVYHGPALVRDIHRQLLGLLRAGGYPHISAAVGAAHSTQI